PASARARAAADCSTAHAKAEGSTARGTAAETARSCPTRGPGARCNAERGQIADDELQPRRELRLGQRANLDDEAADGHSQVRARAPESGRARPPWPRSELPGRSDGARTRSHGREPDPPPATRRWQ